MQDATSSSPKKIIAAAIVAGLLAAGLGTYYLREQSASAPAAAQASARATAALMALPELKAWSAAIEKLSHGARHGGVLESNPDMQLLNGKSYLQLGFIEDGAEAAHVWENFLVTPDGSEILVEDMTGEGPMSLERWRKEQHPMDRVKQQ